MNRITRLPRKSLIENAIAKEEQTLAIIEGLEARDSRDEAAKVQQIAYHKRIIESMRRDLAKVA